MLSHMEAVDKESTPYAIQINEESNDGSIQLTTSDHINESVEVDDAGIQIVDDKTQAGSNSCKSMLISKWRIPIICCFSGLCFALWPVLSALANTSSNAPESEGTAQGELSPYAFFLLFRIGGLFGAACTLPWFMKHPILV